MAEKTLPELDAAGAVADADLVFTRQSSAVIDTKQTFAAIKAWVKAFVTKDDVGLDQVDNTSDADKPVSTAQQTALDGKAESGNNVSIFVNDAGYTTNAGDMEASTYDPDAIGGDAFLLSNMKMTRNDQTGTSYTLVDADHGKVVTLNNASAIVLTVPDGLRSDFNCVILQKGDGVFTITPSVATVGNRQGHTDSAGKYASVSIVSLGSDAYISQGDTA